MNLVEIEDHKKKGLCYNYDEKFDPSHRYATQKLYLLNLDAPVEHPNKAFEDAMEEILEEEEKSIKVVP